MTATTDTTGHPDVAEISDLAEGLLPTTRTSDVRRHLDECELCADVYTSLEEIRGLLGTLPGPPRMPADVASRIDAALAAEALLSATAPDAMDTPAPFGAHVSRETSTTAERPVGQPRTSTTGPGRKNRKQSGRRRIAVLGTVFTAAALGLGSVLLSSLNNGTPSADTLSEGKLQEQVAELLSTTTKKSSEGESRAPDSFGVQSTPEVSTLIEPTVEVPPCIRQGIGREQAAIATKEGTYKGKDALLVVLPDASDNSRVNAYVVDSACVGQSSSAAAKVLLTRSYARS